MIWKLIHKAKFWLMIGLFVWAGCVKADTVWDVSGEIMSDGNQGSSVTVDYGYTLDVSQISNDYIFTTSNRSISGSGSLGNNYTIAGFVSTEGLQGYVPIYDSLGDEIDLFSETVPVFAGWYKCFNLCFADFMPAGAYSGWNAWMNGAAGFTMTQTATDPPSSGYPVETPESSAVAQVVVGLIGLAGFGIRRRSV